SNVSSRALCTCPNCISDASDAARTRILAQRSRGDGRAQRTALLTFLQDGRNWTGTQAARGPLGGRPRGAVFRRRGAIRFRTPLPPICLPVDWRYSLAVPRGTVASHAVVRPTANI